jgi:hypothetical protein
MLLVRPLREAVLDVLEAHEGRPESLTSTRQSAADLGIASLAAVPTPRTEPPPPAQGGLSTIPPTVVTTPPPEIPRSPKVPVFGEARVLGRLAGSIGARDWHGYAERAVWMAAGVVLVVGAMLALRIHEPRTPGSPGTAVGPHGSAEQLPVCQGAQVAASPPPSAAASDRIYSISELPIESTAAVPRPPAAQAVAVAAPVARQRRATPKSVTGSAAEAAEPAEGNPPRSAAASEPLGRTLDADAARRALDAAARRARLCAEQGARGSVVVTINGAGRVQNVSLSSTAGSHDGCLLRAFGQVRVPPFSGPPVTVRKSFSVE